MNLTSIYARPDRAEILYRLLAERNEISNISHRLMPCWGDHLRFVESRPYEAWYFIVDKEPVGACYLSKHNEIGVFVFKAHQGKGYGKKAIKELMGIHGSRRYLANINPQNDRSTELFRRLGFKHIQQTYELHA